jgi:hypothetical protein
VTSSSERRPSLLAGNHVMPRVVQAGPVALMIYDLDRPWTELHLTQLFAAPDASSAQPPASGPGWSSRRPSASGAPRHSRLSPAAFTGALSGAHQASG